MIHDPLPHPNEEPFVAIVTHDLRMVPSANVIVGRGLPELAKEIGLEAVGELALLMAFVRSNGAVAPSVADIASALGRPGLLVRLRLMRLARRYWRGQPLLRVCRRPSGWETFHPTLVVLGRREALPPVPATLDRGAPAARERVIEASRAAYARPREEVEREMRSNQGWPHPDELQAIADAAAKPPKDLDERWAVERLAKEKVDYSLAVKLVKEYGAERCLRQLRRLPYRKGIKNVARYIVGAIQGDYAGPDDQAAG